MVRNIPLGERKTVIESRKRVSVTEEVLREQPLPSQDDSSGEGTRGCLGAEKQEKHATSFKEKTWSESSSGCVDADRGGNPGSPSVQI